MFFVVDVETSGLSPWTGDLLTIGMVPVTENGTVLDRHFYVALEHTAMDPRSVASGLTPTDEFWLEQPPEIIDTAFNERPRVSKSDARRLITSWVTKVEPDINKRFISANPVAFDKMWLEYLYSTNYDIEWPFHYRCLCLRSMRYGLELDSVEYGAFRGFHKSSHPHHALHDAIAEAVDLADMIKMKQVMTRDFLNS